MLINCYVLFILYVYIVARDGVRVYDTGESCVLCVYCLELEGTSIVWLVLNDLCA